MSNIDWFFDLHRGKCKSNEEWATLLSQDKKALRWRLNECKSVLSPWLKKFFLNAKFDFEGKRLVGDGVYLQWVVRLRPTDPIDYENQQTNIGDVIIIWKREHLC